MKKNVMMRVASALLVAVLLSTCVISGTFAKYTTSGNANDTARVAKFGVEVVANGSAFGHFYKSAGGTISYIYDSSVDSVASSNGDKLVAPGTKGDVVAMSITGTPEVDVKVTYTAALTLSNWTVGGAEYCPIEITVGSTTYKIGVNATDIADLEGQVEAAINGYSAEYSANTNLNDTGIVAVPSISWEWDFEGNDDVKDTALGDAAAAGNAATITLDITTTVTQID
jgi:hypothetical protein